MTKVFTIEQFNAAIKVAAENGNLSCHTDHIGQIIINSGFYRWKDGTIHKIWEGGRDDWKYRCDNCEDEFDSETCIHCGRAAIKQF